MVKLECKLGKYGFSKNNKGSRESYVFIPTKKPYDEYVKLVVSGVLARDTLESLKIPCEFGDVIEVDLSPKQTQSRLVKK